MTAAAKCHSIFEKKTRENQFHEIFFEKCSYLIMTLYWKLWMQNDTDLSNIEKICCEVWRVFQLSKIQTTASNNWSLHLFLVCFSICPTNQHILEWPLNIDFFSVRSAGAKILLLLIKLSFCWHFDLQFQLTLCWEQKKNWLARRAVFRTTTCCSRRAIN